MVSIRASGLALMRTLIADVAIQGRRRRLRYRHTGQNRCRGTLSGFEYRCQIPAPHLQKVSHCAAAAK